MDTLPTSARPALEAVAGQATTPEQAVEAVRD
jgi:hypothetical protein